MTRSTPIGAIAFVFALTAFGCSADGGAETGDAPEGTAAAEASGAPESSIQTRTAEEENPLLSPDSPEFVILAAPDGGFAPPAPYPAGLESWDVAAGDLDGTGGLDLACANWGGTTGSVSVHRNDGAGTFGPPTHLQGGSRPSAVAIGDLDGIATADIVAANYGSEDVSVFLSAGGGSFSPAITYPLPLAVPRSVAIGDVDGAAGSDLVVGGAGTWLLRNTSAGAFGAPEPLALDGDYVALADLDGASGLDVISVDIQGTMSILLNDGAGTFDAAVTYPVGYSAYRPAVLDLDGVNGPDVVVPGWADLSLVMFLNDGSGAFSPGVRYDAGGRMPWMAVGYDLEGDGDLDVALSCFESDFVSLLSNSCLSAPVSVPDPAPVPRTTLDLSATSPFMGGTRFRWALPAAGYASLSVFDVRGRALKHLVRGPIRAGAHQTEWDGRDETGTRVETGVYFGRLRSGGLARTVKVVRVR